MGFRYKRFDYTGGVAPFNEPATEEGRLNISKAILTEFGNFITTCNKGWQLDSTKNQSATDYSNVPVWDYQQQTGSFSAPALFFKNTISNCKLFLCVCGFSNSYGIAIDKLKTCMSNGYDTNFNLISGVILSIIPGESNDEFGDPQQMSTFLPDTATRIYGTVQNYSYSSPVPGKGIIESNITGTKYSYGLFIDTACVGIGGVSDNYVQDNLIRPGLFVGKIFGTLAHSADNLSTSQYGLFRVWDHCSPYGGSGVREFFYVSAKDLSPRSNNITIRCYGLDFYEFSTYDSSTYDASHNALAWNMACFNASGTWVDCRSFTNSENVTRPRVYPHTNIAVAYNPYVTDINTISGSARWVPYEAAIYSKALATDGVIPGDGFKGYLDTNLFRSCTDNTINKLYDNGNFITAGHYMMLGWDPSNTDTF